MTQTLTPDVYAKMGWKVFPCHYIKDGACSCGNANCTSPGKHPRTKNGVSDATTDIEQLRAWWAQNPYVNWALATGKESGVFVVDVDYGKGGYESWGEYLQKHSLNIDTLMASTGGGGQHFLFDYPTGARIGNRVNWLPGVDIRGDGGYVILAPGNHISGNSYQWMNWGAQRPTSAPQAIVESIIGRGGGLGAQHGALGDTDKLILEGVQEGSRDDQIFRAACKWRRQMGDGAKAAITALVLMMARNSTPPFPDDEALAKVEQAFKQDRSDLIDDSLFSGGGRGSDDDDGDGDDDGTMFRLTDHGLRDRFVRAYGDDYRWAVGRGWFKWTDVGWVSIPEEVIREQVEEVPDMVRADIPKADDPSMRARIARFADASESASTINNILALTKNEGKMRLTAEDFDAVPHELACRNGMIDLRTGDIRPFRRDDLFTRNTGIVYDPSFALPQWEQFLTTSTQGDDEMIEYLQMAAGYTLTGSVAEECFFIISGPRQSGKSTFMSGLESAMGTYADVSSADTFMKKWGQGEAPREEVVKFVGARLISTEEIPEGERFNDAFIKRITGGTTLTARLLYQEAFSFMPQFKLWMATNHDPVTSDSAMFRRIKRIPFSHTIPEGERDPKLKAMLKDREVGARAILAWAVQGAVKYYQHNRLLTPSSIRMSTTDYQMAQDTFSHFLNETYNVSPGNEIPFSTFYNHYTLWMKEANERPAKRPVVLDRLAERNIKVSTKDSGDRVVMGLSVRVDRFTNTL